MKIRYEPATCWAGCNDADCPYSHGETWFVGDTPYFTKVAAEAAAAREADNAREDQITLKTGDDLTNALL